MNTVSIKQLIREVLTELGHTEWLSTEQIAEKLSFDQSTVRRWCAEGSLPAKKFGKEYRVKQTDFKQFCENR